MQALRRVQGGLQFAVMDLCQQRVIVACSFLLLFWVSCSGGQVRGGLTGAFSPWRATFHNFFSDVSVMRRANWSLKFLVYSCYFAAFRTVIMDLEGTMGEFGRDGS